jgi:uncharacterized protein involved in tolerance to divalent cations
MQQKKELLINVITKLKWHWDLAEWILALLESSYIDDKAIDWLIDLVSKSIKACKNNVDTNKMKKWLEKIQEIKELENAEKLSEEDLDALLESI